MPRQSTPIPLVLIPFLEHLRGQAERGEVTFACVNSYTNALKRLERAGVLTMERFLAYAEAQTGRLASLAQEQTALKAFVAFQRQQPVIQAPQSPIEPELLTRLRNAAKAASIWKRTDAQTFAGLRWSDLTPGGPPEWPTYLISLLMPSGARIAVGCGSAQEVQDLLRAGRPADLLFPA